MIKAYSQYFEEEIHQAVCCRILVQLLHIIRLELKRLKANTWSVRHYSFTIKQDLKYLQCPQSDHIGASMPADIQRYHVVSRIHLYYETT
jgi:hypothetical protein